MQMAGKESGYRASFEAVYSADMLLGLMTVGPRELPLFSKRIEDACRLTIKQYYLKPWIDGLQDSPLGYSSYPNTPWKA